MTLAELKALILEDVIYDDLLIFRCTKPGKAKARPDCFFLANQYIDEICSRRGLTRNSITSLSDLSNTALSLVFDFCSDLNVITTPVFEENVENFSDYKNVIIVCNEVDKKLEPKLADYIVDFAPANEWQTIAYMKAICSGLPETDYKWLYTVTSGNLDRITNELDKINLFNVTDRPMILQELKLDPRSDLFVLDYYDLINAIITKDLKTVYSYLEHIDLFDFDAIGMTTALLSNYKRLLYIRFGNSSLTQEANISSGQAYAINRNYPVISEKELLRKINFLSNIDNRLKSSELELDKQALIAYIICNILS